MMFLKITSEHPGASEMRQIHTEANEGNEVGTRSSFSSFASVTLSGCRLVGQPVDGAGKQAVEEMIAIGNGPITDVDLASESNGTGNCHRSVEQ
jgi:hypothetical protein